MPVINRYSDYDSKVSVWQMDHEFQLVTFEIENITLLVLLECNFPIFSIIFLEVGKI